MIKSFFSRLFSYKFYPAKLYFFSPATEKLSILTKVPQRFFFDNNNQPVSYCLQNLDVVKVQKREDGVYQVISQKFVTTVYSSAEDAVVL